MPKYGDVREDGKVYWGYDSHKNKHRWVSSELLKRMAKKINKRRRDKTRRRKYWLGKYKQAKGCEFCGYKDHHAALHFDHLDIYQKIKDVSKMASGNLSRLIQEVRKCRVLCANCHSAVSYNQYILSRRKK